MKWRKWVLAAGCGSGDISMLREEWFRYGMTLQTVADVMEITGELYRNVTYLLVIIFSDSQEHLPLLKPIREMTKVPILILSREYSSTEKTAAIEAGADEYIRWSDDYLAETVASGRALIRRYTELNQAGGQPINILLRGALSISVDYRKVFAHAQEVEFSRKEFDLLYLLASIPGRVFTNEQLYRDVWGDDYLRDADNGLHSCLNRIRRKLEDVPDVSCRIENVRGVGYRFIQDDI